MASQQEYFATLPVIESAPLIFERIENYYRYVNNRGIRNLWEKAYYLYYRAIDNEGNLVPGGDLGEFTLLYINQFRNLLQHLYALVTSSKISFEGRALNSDVESAKQAILASALLDFYLRDKKLERHFHSAVESALLFSEGFVATAWDVHAGEDYTPDDIEQEGVDLEEETSILKTGDMEYKDYTPLDVIRDVATARGDKSDWVILRDFVNRHDMIARYPEFKDRILSITDKEKKRSEGFGWVEPLQGNTGDEIAQYLFYHRKSPSVPNGRQMLLLDEELALFDGPLPYDEVPVYRIVGSEKIGDLFGYSVGFDLMAIQDGIDILHSTIMTNQALFGVQSIAVQKNAGIAVSSLVEGLNLIEYEGQTPPQPINFTSTPPEVFTYLEKLENEAETISGINSVVRGNPEQNLKSGTALALVQATAIQFSMGLQRSLAELAEDVGTATIRTLKVYADAPRIAAIAGISKIPMVESFNKEDLEQVDRVLVDLGNPLLRSTAGKVNLAEMLLGAGMIDTPQQLIQVISTGQLEPLIENQQQELILIREENEGFGKGESSPAIITDNHALHIMEHRAVAANVQARQNPEVLIALDKHLQKHIELLRTMDPILAGLTNQPVLGQQPGSAQPELPPNQPANPINGVAGILNAENPITQQAVKVRPAKLPKLPEGTDPNLAQAARSTLPPQ